MGNFIQNLTTAIRTSYFAFHVAFDADYMNRIFVHILQQQSPKSMMP